MPYGGVKLAVDGINNSYDVELPFTWPFLVADVALSAVGDTLALPLTLPIAFVNAINDGINKYYFLAEKAKPAAPSEPAKPNTDTPTHHTPETVHGGIL